MSNLRSPLLRNFPPILLAVLPIFVAIGFASTKPIGPRPAYAVGSSAPSIVALGNSITFVGIVNPRGWLNQYQQDFNARFQTGSTIVDLSTTAITSQQLLDRIQNDSSARSQISAARIVTLEIGYNDFLQNRGSHQDGSCGGADNQDCLRSMVSTFDSNWDTIVSQIESLTTSSPQRAAIRAFDIYYSVAAVDQLSSPPYNSSFGVLNSYLAHMNRHIADSATQHDIPFARVHDAFNGTSGAEDPISRGYILNDAIHPTDSGHSVIAGLMEELGYNPISPMRIATGGTHTCFVTASGGLQCWGNNEGGQLGSGSSQRCLAGDLLLPCSTTPMDVSTLASGVAGVSAGDIHTCALTTAGGVKCWGGNQAGELGVGTSTGPETCGRLRCSTTPLDVTGLTSDIAAISAGGAHTCALTASGGIKCWGDNRFGQLGTGTSRGPETCGGFACSTRPVDVSGLTRDVIAVASGEFHTCALTSVGDVKCWGANFYGQLANHTDSGPETCSGLACSTVPLDVEPLSGPSGALSSGGLYSCALGMKGSVKCWGANQFGQLGRRPDSGPQFCAAASPALPGSPCNTSPADVAHFNNDVAGIALGGDHACAVTVMAGVKCWGANFLGQLGDGTMDAPQSCHVGSVTYTCSSTPVDVVGLSGVTALAVGRSHSCALSLPGTPKCWGDDTVGQLGDGTTTMRSSPIDVASTKLPAGDVQCDGVINSIDATLLLQVSAGFVSSLGCSQNADVSRDARIDSIDAALILQFDAGLLAHLPS